MKSTGQALTPSFPWHSRIRVLPLRTPGPTTEFDVGWCTLYPGPSIALTHHPPGGAGAGGLWDAFGETLVQEVSENVHHPHFRLLSFSPTPLSSFIYFKSSKPPSQEEVEKPSLRSP